MKISHCAIALALALTACNSSDPAASGASGKAPGASDKAAATGTELDGLPLVVDNLPAGVVKNELGAGLHSDDGAYSIMLKATGDTDAKDMASAKKSTEEMFFKKWTKSEKTPDGWVLTWVGVGLDIQGKEYDNYSFSVRRKIGAGSYDCYGGVKKQADVEKNVTLCQAIKPAP